MSNARTFFCLLLIGLSFFYMPEAKAFDSEKTVLLAYNSAKTASPEDVATLLNKLRTQFKFPKYEVLNSFQPSPTLTDRADRASLEKIAETAGANAVLVLDIRKFSSYDRLFGREIIEETTVNLALIYYNKKTDQFGQINGERSITDIAGINTSALSVSLDVMEEMLNKLDSIFPRQFPGPRY